MKNLVLCTVFTGLIAGFAAYSAPASADNCDRTRNGYDEIYCSRKIYQQADAELNKNYKALRAKLGASSKNAAILKQGQLRWIRERDEECMSDSSTLNVDCALESTKERNTFLQDRLRECRTVGCMRSKLDG